MAAGSGMLRTIPSFAGDISPSLSFVSQETLGGDGEEKPSEVQQPPGAFCCP